MPNIVSDNVDNNYVEIKLYEDKYDYENSITLTEEINYPLMHKLITESNCNEDDLIELHTYKKNFNNLDNKHPYVKVSYCQKLDQEGNPIGRFYPIGVPTCLTRMKRNLRNILIKDIYQDIDIENCAPSILYNICLINNIQCLILKDYVLNRNIKLKQLCNELSINNQSTVKQLIIQLTYGGSDTKDNLFLENYKKEIKDITNKLKQIKTFNKYLDYVKENDENIDGKFLSCLIYDFENKILMEAYSYFINNNFTVGTLEFDGLKVKKNTVDGSKVLNRNLTEISKIIKNNLNFEIKFIIKKIDIDEEYKNILKELKNRYIIYNDVEGRDIMASLYKDKFVFTQPKVCFVNTNNIWEEKKERETILNSLVTFINNEDIRKITKISKNEDTGEKQIITKQYSKESGGAKALAGLWISTLSHNCYKNKNFNDLMYSSTIGKICFEDGVYDFRKAKFVPWKNCHNVFSQYKINCKYKDVEKIDNKHVKKVKSKIMEACLKPDIVDYFLNRLSRSIAGFITDKKWCVLLGFRNSGKGVIIEMLKEAFGNDYIKNMNSGNLSIKNSSGDTAKLQSWMCDLEFARIVYSNEVSVEKGKLDGNTIKLIASGGDAVTARRNHENERTFKTQYTYFLCCNDLPDIVPSDANQTRELFDFPWQFKSKNEIEENNKKNVVVLKNIVIVITAIGKIIINLLIMKLKQIFVKIILID